MPCYQQSPKGTFAAYGIYLYKEKSSAIKQLQNSTQATAHGDRHWDSAYLLMDYFTFFPIKSKKSILDIGCGWGPASIYLASRGHKVTALDLDHQVFEFLQLQAELNDVKIQTQIGSLDNMSTKKLTAFETIIGADICFWPSLEQSWFKLIKRAQKAGVKHIVIADPGRQPFFDLAEKCKGHWKTELEPWYCLEPKKWAGHLLRIELQAD